jgi:hypothetical protein
MASSGAEDLEALACDCVDKVCQGGKSPGRSVHAPAAHDIRINDLPTGHTRFATAQQSNARSASAKSVSSVARSGYAAVGWFWATSLAAEAIQTTQIPTAQPPRYVGWVRRL